MDGDAPVPRLVVAGIALGGAGVAANAAQAAIDWGASPFMLAQAVTALGLLLVALALTRSASEGAAGAGPLLAGGATLAAAGKAWTFGEVLGFSGNLYLLGEAALLVGLVQLAWYALRLGLGGGDLAGALVRARWPLTLCVATVAVGHALHVPLALRDGLVVFGATSGVMLAGFALATAAWARALRADRAAAAARNSDEAAAVPKPAIPSPARDLAARGADDTA